jgi:hypothetical protein
VSFAADIPERTAVRSIVASRAACTVASIDCLDLCGAQTQMRQMLCARSPERSRRARIVFTVKRNETWRGIHPVEFEMYYSA